MSGKLQKRVLIGSPLVQSPILPRFWTSQLTQSSNGVRMAHQLTVELLTLGLQTRRIGRQVIVLDQVQSTNDYALQTIAPSQGRDADGLAIFAEHQTAGRGRLGRSWQAPRGSSLTFTTLLWERDLPSSPVR